MGILGEYVARTYMETKRRPKYFIKDSNLKTKYNINISYMRRYNDE